MFGTVPAVSRQPFRAVRVRRARERRLNAPPDAGSPQIEGTGQSAEMGPGPVCDVGRADGVYYLTNRAGSLPRRASRTNQSQYRAAARRKAGGGPLLHGLGGHERRPELGADAALLQPREVGV